MPALACLSRRAFMAGSAAFVAMAGLDLLGCSTSLSDGSAGPGTEEGADHATDTYYENGTVYTVDANDPMAAALAVRDGKIIYVGDADNGRPYKNAAENVVDLQGKFVLPGMIDVHIHSVSPDFFDFMLVGKTSSDDMLKTIKDYVDSHPDKETYSGFGYAAALFPD